MLPDLLFYGGRKGGLVYLCSFMAMQPEEETGRNGQSQGLLTSVQFPPTIFEQLKNSSFEKVIKLFILEYRYCS